MLLSTRPIAETLMLEEKIIPATVDYLSNLLVGPWPEEDFVIVPPETLITDFQLKTESPTMLQQ
jgi:hypothetical protein